MDLFISELDLFFSSWANHLGVLGVISVLTGYLLLQMELLRADSLKFNLLNLCGSSLILISLYYYWNLASGIIEAAWWLISLYGSVKVACRLKKAKSKPKTKSHTKTVKKHKK